MHCQRQRPARLPPLRSGLHRQSEGLPSAASLREGAAEAEGLAGAALRRSPGAPWLSAGPGARPRVAEEHALFGPAAQRAARICARAEPGQILAANVVRELAAGKGFLFADQGDVVLRGFEDPLRLYEVRW